MKEQNRIVILLNANKLIEQRAFKVVTNLLDTGE